MEEELELRLIIYGLGFLGLIAFFGALTHDMFGLEYENPKIGMADIFIALMGVTLMIPSILLMFSIRPAILALAVLGIIMFLFAVLHDFLGFHLSPNTIIGKIDLFVSLVGIVLLIPCILFFFGDEEERVVYLAILGIILFFGALTHDALGLTFNKYPKHGPLDRISLFFGVMLMSLFFLLRLSLSEKKAKIIFVLGLLIFFGSLFHDFIGIRFTESNHIGLVDSLFAFWGVILLIPYPMALSEKEQKRYHLRKR
ncbi:MAG: hypothetical protein ABH950_01175 [Candidatus Altiarchaeota archaeon]